MGFSKENPKAVIPKGLSLPCHDSMIPTEVDCTTRKKVIGEGRACDGPLRSITNVSYGDGP